MAESVGTARIDVEVQLKNVDASIKAAKSKVGALGTEAEKSFKKANAQSKQAAAGYTRQAGAIGKSVKQQLLYNAAMRGVPVEYLERARSAVSGIRLTSVGLINPLTLTAAAFGAVAFAAYQGRQEQVAYQKALITTGNIAGVTSAQLNSYARDIDKVAGTQSAAAAALVKVVSTGRFAADEVKKLGHAVSVAGDNGDKLLQSFVKLSGKPLSTLIELNHQEHFLTLEQYEQVAALEAQGRARDAARRATEIYADVSIRRIKDVNKNLGSLERGWNSVKNAAKEAWDFVQNVGRPETEVPVVSEQMLGRGLPEGVPTLAEVLKRRDITTWYVLTHRSEVEAAYAEQQRIFSSLEAKREAGARRKAGLQSANEGAIALKEQLRAFETAEQKRARDIAKAHQDANDFAEKAIAAGNTALAAKIRADEAKLVAAIAASGASKGPKGPSRAEQAAQALNKSNADMAAYSRAQMDREAKSWDRGREAAARYANTLQDMLATREAQAAMQVRSIGLGDREIAIMQQRIAVDLEYNSKRADLQRRQQSTTDAILSTWYTRQLEDLDQHHQARLKLIDESAKREALARKDAMLGLARVTSNFADYWGNTAARVGDVWGSVLDGMVDNTTAMMTGQRADWKAFVADILKMIAKMQVAKAIAGLVSGASDGLNFGVGSSYLAKGGVFVSPSLSQYSGGVYDQPTPFTFAKGAGVFGEAGPEAIMPLKRGPDGRLGVAATGGGGASVVVNQSINVTNTGSDARADVGNSTDAVRQFTKRMEAVAKQTIADEQRPGGSLWRMVHA